MRSWAVIIASFVLASSICSFAAVQGRPGTFRLDDLLDDMVEERVPPGWFGEHRLASYEIPNETLCVCFEQSITEFFSKGEEIPPVKDKPSPLLFRGVGYHVEKTAVVVQQLLKFQMFLIKKFSLAAFRRPSPDFS